MFAFDFAGMVFTWPAVTFGVDAVPVVGTAANAGATVAAANVREAAKMVSFFIITLLLILIFKQVRPCINLYGRADNNVTEKVDMPDFIAFFFNIPIIETIVRACSLVVPHKKLRFHGAGNTAFTS